MIDPEQQERWLRARARRYLDPADPQFGRAGLLGRLDGAGIGVFVLPADDLAQPVDFEDELLARMPERFTGVTANGVGSLSVVTSTSEALVRYAPGFGDEGWRGFVAVERCGAVVCGVGATSRYSLPGGLGAAEVPSVLHLFMLAHLVRVAVHLQSSTIDWAQKQSPVVPIEGPFEVIVAIPESAGMLLGGLNAGWEEPQYSMLPPPRALESNIMVRMQLEEWPKDEVEVETMAISVLDRACEAFGDRDQRYLSNQGPTRGTMDKNYA